MDASSFDLDSLAAGELEMDGRPDALYGLGHLRDVLSQHEEFLPDVKLEASHKHEFQYTAPGMKKLRVTVSPEYYDTHAGDVELWSPGNPAFPDPADVVDRQAAEKVTLDSLLSEPT